MVLDNVGRSVTSYVCGRSVGHVRNQFKSLSRFQQHSARTGLTRSDANPVFPILADFSCALTNFAKRVDTLTEKPGNNAASIDGAAFEEVEHTADRALKIFGSDLRELLINAARGMNSLMVKEPAASPATADKTVTVELEAMDAEELLVEWLNELAFWAEMEMLIFRRFDLHEVSSTCLTASISGSKAQQLEKHIKAVTYHNLEIVRTAAGLSATVVFDV
jgi:SHS2 domain-containing protein